MKKKKTIGRVDRIDFPDLGIQNAVAKIDTGAYTSSIHCKKIYLEEGLLCFHIPMMQDKETKVKKFRTQSFTQRKVRSSNGQIQHRFVIKTHVTLFGKNYKAEFSLTDRSKMKNPVLIGRKLLKDRFLVDVTEKNLSFEAKKKDK